MHPGFLGSAQGRTERWSTNAKNDDVMVWTHFSHYCPFLGESTGHQWIHLLKWQWWGALVVFVVGEMSNKKSNCLWFNTLRPRQNGRHFPGDIFKCIFLNENVWISIKNSLKFVPKVPINDIPALVQIMAWRRPGDKLLSEPVMFSLLTLICVIMWRWWSYDITEMHYCFISQPKVTLGYKKHLRGNYIT